MVGISVSITVSMSISIPGGMSVSMVGISQMSITTISVVSISSSLGLGSGSWLGISRPLAIISVSISMETMAITLVAIVGTGISTGFSLTGSSGEQTEGNNSNGFHHFDACKLEDLARLPMYSA